MAVTQKNSFDGDSVVFRVGEVISVDDPLRNFRCQVRIFGVTDDKKQIPDKDLPWYSSAFPVTGGSIAGTGQSLGLRPGSRVMVMVFDYPKCQQCVIMGSMYPGESSFPSIPIAAKGLLDKAHGPEIVKGYNYGPVGSKFLNDVINNVKVQYEKLYQVIQIFKNFIPK